MFGVLVGIDNKLLCQGIMVLQNLENCEGADPEGATDLEGFGYRSKIEEGFLQKAYSFSSIWEWG